MTQAAAPRLPVLARAKLRHWLHEAAEFGASHIAVFWSPVDREYYARFVQTPYLPSQVVMREIALSGAKCIGTFVIETKDGGKCP